MMAVSYNFGIRIAHLLDGGYHDYSDFRTHSFINIEQHNTFDSFLHVNLDLNHLEVPIFCRHYIEELNHIKILSAFSEINIALFDSNYCAKMCKTSSSAIKEFVETNTNRRLSKIIMPNGTYYGGRGIILDENKEPIFFAVLEGSVKDDIITYTNLKIYIRPSVLISDKTLEKSITKQLIPYYILHLTHMYTVYEDVKFKFPLYGSNTIIPEVIVKSFDKDFFIHATTPNANTFDNNNINEFLLNNVDNVRDIMIQ